MKNIFKLFLIIPTALFYSCSEDPEANFELSTDNVEINRNVKFTNKSLNAASYYWEFGDSQKSTSTNPEISYNIAGTYTITLQAIDEKEKKSDSFSNSITVQNPNEKFIGTYQGSIEINEEISNATVTISEEADKPYKLIVSISTKSILLNAEIDEKITSTFSILNNDPNQAKYAGSGQINVNKLAFVAFLSIDGSKANIAFNGSK